MNHLQMITLFKWAGKLKTIRRTGWTNSGIRPAESVADHSFRVAFMAMLLAEGMGLDPLRLMQMSLIHDLAEAKVGDITPFCGISREEKRQREQAALTELFGDMDGGKYWLNLWIEYEEQQTAEAVAVKHIDKLEMALQAMEYGIEHMDKDLSEFVREAGASISLPAVRALFEDLPAAFKTDPMETEKR